MAFATSSGVPSRRSGSCSTIFSVPGDRMAVSISPGEIALTRTPRGPKSAARKRKPHLSDNDGANGVARARQQSFEQHADCRMFERTFLAQISELCKLLSHSAEFPGRAFGISPNAPERFGRLGIFPKSKQGLGACRSVEPCAAYRQVFLDTLAQLPCAFAAFGQPVARRRQEILEERRVDLRVGVIPQFVFGCAFIELCR